MTQRRKMAQTVLAIAVIATLFMTSCTWSGGTTPETLPKNRYPLSFTGAVSGVYDGSAALTIDIPDIIERTDVTVPAYVNLLPMSVDGSDMPLDGVGYRQECALGGNGAERSAAGVGVSGFIPVKKGDVIRVADPEKRILIPHSCLRSTERKRMHQVMWEKRSQTYVMEAHTVRLRSAVIL